MTSPSHNSAASVPQDVVLDATTGETLALSNSSVGRILVQGHYGPPGYPMTNATLSVHGYSSIAGITEGWLRAAPVSLAVTIAAGAKLTNTGPIKIYNNASLTMVGGANSSFTNSGVIDTWGAATTITFGVDIKGTGTIIDGVNIYGQPGTTIEFGGAVSAGQTITLNSGMLQLDKPMQFHAVIAELNAAPPPAYDPTRGLRNGAILLEHIYAETGSFTSSELVLKHQGATVADLHFTGLGAPGHANLFLTAEAGGSMAVTGYAMPGSFAIHA